MLAPYRVFLALAALILSYQLFIPPAAAIADNGDFGKVIGRFGLVARGNSSYAFAGLTYDRDPSRTYSSGFFSSETLLVCPALALNGLLSKDGSFDVRCIGAVHAALFLAALALFAPLLADVRPRLQAAIYALVLIIFCDAMYVCPLNSFYMDEAAYVFLLLSAVAWLRVMRWHRRVDTVLLGVFLALLVTAKSQHAPLAAWFAVLLFVARRRLWPRHPMRVAAAAGILASGSVLMLAKGAPPGYPLYGYYNVTFLEILPHSKNLPATMRDLGLDASYLPYIGKIAFERDSGMNSEEFRRQFARKISFSSLARFYLTHPRDAWRTLRNQLGAAGRQRFPVGSFDASAGFPPYTESHAFAQWSDFKRALFFHQGRRFFFTILAVAAGFAFALFRQRKTFPPGSLAAGAVLLGMAFSELGASLADAADVERHHMMFFTLTDILFIAALYLTCRLITGASRAGASAEPQTAAAATSGATVSR
jgi:hypothetical protein